MDRKNFIGGSDAVKIMNADWYELWQVKMGLKEPDDLSSVLAVQLGIHTEEFNLRWFEENTQQTVDSHQMVFTHRISGVPYQGTIDGMVGSSIIEAKHTFQNNNMEVVLKDYMPQIQLYMMLAESPACFLSVIFGNGRWDYAKVRYDEKYVEGMKAIIKDFWGYVERGEEPVGIDEPDLSIDKIPVDNMVKRDASTDNMFMDNVVTYINKQWDHKQFETAKENLKEMVGDDEREVYCDQLTVKRDKRGSLRINVRSKA